MARGLLLQTLRRNMAHPERVDILLVEDSPSERELTLRALKQGDQAVNVFVVEEGEEALYLIFSLC